jgi:hypothetical protein
MVAMDDPDDRANNGYRCDDRGYNTSVTPESFVETLYFSWRLC